MSTTNTFSPSYNKYGDARFTDGLSKNARIVIAGAGSFGGWSGIFLKRAGYDVTIVDPWGPGNSRSSSGGETRLIRCIYGDNELYTKMCIRSFELWRSYEKLFGKQVLFDLPTWWFCNNGDDELLEGAIKLMDKFELPYNKISTKRASEILPEVNYSDIGFILEEITSGYLLSKEGSKSVLNYFKELGGNYVYSAYESIEEKEGGIKNIVLKNGEKIPCDVFIAACGPWTASLFPTLSDFFTVTRQEVLYFGTPVGFTHDFPNWVDGIGDEYFYGLPQGNHRGFKIALDKHGQEINPTTEERVPNQTYLETCRKFLGHRFPKLADAPLIEHRVCQYTNTPDGNFIFDVHPEYSNCWILSGGSGHGFKHGPALGEMVAQIISGEQAIEPLFEFQRFDP